MYLKKINLKKKYALVVYHPPQEKIESIKKHFDVSKNCFFPKPKVDSTLLSFYPKKEIYKLKNPKNLTRDWIEFFDGLNEDSKNILENIKGPSWNPKKKKADRISFKMDGDKKLRVYSSDKKEIK